MELLLKSGADDEVYDRLGYSAYALALKAQCERSTALLSNIYDRTRLWFSPLYVTCCPVTTASLFAPPRLRGKSVLHVAYTVLHVAYNHAMRSI